MQFCPFKTTAQLFCNALNERGASRGPQGKRKILKIYSMSMASSKICNLHPYTRQYGQQASHFLCGVELIVYKPCYTDGILINASLNLKAGFPAEFYIMPGK